MIYQAAANQSESGERVPAKTVPAVTDVRRSHAAQRNKPSPIRQFATSPQAGHTNPAGQRSRSKQARHAASSGNHASNSRQLSG